MARAISRDINQHQLDTGFAVPFDFKNGDLECDWEEYAATALAARTASRKWMEEHIHEATTGIGQRSQDFCRGWNALRKLITTYKDEGK